MILLGIVCCGVGWFVPRLRPLVYVGALLVGVGLVLYLGDRPVY